MIFLCDAGGTHIRFALAQGKKLITVPQKLKIADYPDFPTIASHYLYSQKCSGETITDLKLSFSDRNKWQITADTVKQFLPHAAFEKINDFEANAMGIAAELKASGDHFLLLNTPDGEASMGASKTVIGVGTGLGLAYINKTSQGNHIQRTHGGHMLPACNNERHQSVFTHLQKIKPDQTIPIYEDALSGRGLWAIYTATAAATKTHSNYKDTNDMIARGRNDPLVQQTLKIFHEILGIFIHQAVAFGFSYHGVYLTGGIIDRLVGHDLLDCETIEKIFKQNNVPLINRDVGATPIYWVKDEFIALKGLLA